MVCKQISDDAMESMWSRLLSDFPKILGKIWLWLSALMNKINWKAKIFCNRIQMWKSKWKLILLLQILTKSHWLFFIWSVVFHESIGSERLIDASKLFFLFSNNSTFFTIIVFKCNMHRGQITKNSFCRDFYFWFFLLWLLSFWWARYLLLIEEKCNQKFEGR